MRGRKPTPTVLQALRGTVNVTRAKQRKHEPKPAGVLPAKPPLWMSKEQAAGWRYAIRHAPAGLLKPIDTGILAVWVIAEAEHKTAAMMQKKLDQEAAMPMLMKGGRGVVMVSPYIGIGNRAALVMMRAAAELGFAPTARPRLAGDASPAADADNPWHQLRVLQGGKE